LFVIEVKGYDNSKKAFNLGKVQFDISGHKGCDNKEMNMVLNKGAVPGAKINFLMDINIPKSKDHAPSIEETQPTKAQEDENKDDMKFGENEGSPEKDNEEQL